MHPILKLVPAALFFSLSGFGQSGTQPDSLKCTQYFDNLAGRQIYRFPGKDAEYKGGTEKFSNYINHNFSYDKSHVDRETNLVFTFIVEADGSVSNVSLQKPVRGVTDDVVQQGIEVLARMPKLKPALCNNKPVAVRVSQPIVVSPNAN